MKKLKLWVLILVAATVTGCATPFPVGVIYTDIQVPYPVAGESSAMEKSGTAECTSVLGLVAVGDASIRQAMQNGHITKVSYVEWSANNILGVIGTYKVTVYGE